MLAGKLRVGLAEQTILIALANASVQAKPVSLKDEQSPVEILKGVFNGLPNYELVVPALIRHGLAVLAENCPMRTGVPLKPMLAHPTKSISEVLDRFDGMHFTCEFKYDGERAQVHLIDESPPRFAIFSRNSEDMLEKYPDIVEMAPGFTRPDVSVRSYVLDCEIVAVDPQSGKLLPFQVLSTRKRKVQCYHGLLGC